MLKTNFSIKGSYNFNLAYLMIENFIKKDHRNKILNCPIILMNDVRPDGQKCTEVYLLMIL